MSGLPPETAERFEKVIMHRVDSSAADALNKLLSGDGTPWTAKPRSAWTRFLVSMLLRAPERLSLLKEFIKDASAPGTQQSRELYEAEKKPGDISFEEFLLKHSDQAAFQTVTLLLNNVRIGEGINKMIWNVITVEQSKHELLTSDRPVIVTNGIGHAHSHIVLPIGPRALFVAVNERAQLKMIQRLSSNELVDSVNLSVVSNAIKYVWARDDRQLRFVQNNISSTANYDLALMPKPSERP